MKRFGWLLLLALLLAPALQRQECHIVDGSRSLLYRGEARSPEQILADAGLPLRPGDLVVETRTDACRTLTVRRMQRAVLICGQRRITVCSRGERVRDLLLRLGLLPGPQLRTGCDPRLPVTDGLAVRLTRVRSETLLLTRTVPPVTRICLTDALPPGERREVCAGCGGEIRTTQAVVTADGQTRRTLVDRRTVGLRQDRIVLEGASPLALRKDPRTDTVTLLTGRRVVYRCALRMQAGAKPAQPGSQGCAAVAADPAVIPEGAKLYIVSDDGLYVFGPARAANDGACSGTELCLYLQTEADCLRFGRRTCTVYVLA